MASRHPASCAGRTGQDPRRTAATALTAINRNPGPDDDAGALRELSFDESGMAVLTAELNAAPRPAHTCIGTEHLLLGVLDAGGPAAGALAAFGLTPETAESLLAAESAKIQARRKAGRE